jgi:replicative DNA helicase
MSQVLAEVMSRLDELHRNPASVTGVATGIHDLDEMTTGLQRGDLIIVAGRSEPWARHSRSIAR